MGRAPKNTPAGSGGNTPATPHEYDLREFVLDRQARNLTPKTLLWYSHSLDIWHAFARASQIQTTEELTPSIVRRFLLHLADAGHNAGGVANIFGALKAFLNWYETESAGADWQNPLHKVKNPRRPTEPLDPLPMPDFRALLSQCERKSFAGDRDRALLLVLLDTGVRHQELTDLHVGDVDMATGSVLVRSGKGRKPRTVFVGATTRRALAAYLRYRGSLADGAPLWITATQGTRLTKSGIRQIVRRRAEQAGIAIPGMHAFRRAFAVNSLRNGMDVVTLQRLLGHTSLNVISRYLKLLTADLQAAHGRYGVVDRLGREDERGPPRR